MYIVTFYMFPPLSPILRVPLLVALRDPIPPISTSSHRIFRNNSATTSKSYIKNMSDGPIKEGDKVQWNWSGGKPGGKVDKIETHGELEIESKVNDKLKC